MPQSDHSRRTFRHLACLGAVLAPFAVQSAFANDQVGPPAPPAGPASQPATTQALRYSPLRTLVWHAMVMANGDATGVRDCYVATTPDDNAIVDAYAHLASSIGKLRKAAGDRFGETGFDDIGFGPIFADEIKRMEKARFALSADKAIVQTGGPTSPPLVLVWKTENWKISVADSFPKNPRRRAARLDAQATAYDELAAEIAAGKYKLAIEARHAGTQKVLAAKQAAEAELATQPTTHP